MTAVFINIDGEIRPPEDSQISVLDRGFLYGDSVYEVVRTYNGRIFALEEHLDRLRLSAARLALELPERAWIAEQIVRTIDAMGGADCYCRIIVTRGSGPITLDPTTATNPVTVVIVKEYEPFPERTYEEGLKLTIPNIRRTSREALDPAIKSGNYLNSVLALGEARRAGFEDALLLDRQGLVTEATSSNIFVVKDGELATPALEYGLLAGVTRRQLINVARENGFKCGERELTLNAVYDADEVLLTSTLREVQPVVRIGDRTIADGVPGPVAARLRALFHEFALSTLQDH